MGTTTVEVGHDYVPIWPSPPVTVLVVDTRRKGVQVQFYTGGKRWFSLISFMRNFTHYKDCVKCTKG